MDGFLIALKVVFPLMALIAVGALCRRVGIVTREQMLPVDTLVFKVFMPCLVFMGLYEGNISLGHYTGLAVAELVITLLSILAGLLCGKKLHPEDGAKAATVACAVSRPNYLMFGVAISQTLYGTLSNAVVLMNPLMVPMNNVVGVVILEKNRSGRVGLGKLLLSILKNPVVLASLLALLMKLLPFSLPEMVLDVVDRLGNITTPLCFFSLGVGMNLGSLRQNRRTVTLACLLRMVILPLVFLPVLALLGFRGEALCSLMVLICAPSAANSYPMAVSMGGDGPLAGQLLCVNVLASLGTIFFGTLILGGLGLL